MFRENQIYFLKSVNLKKIGFFIALEAVLFDPESQHEVKSFLPSEVLPLFTSDPIQFENQIKAIQILEVSNNILPSAVRLLNIDDISEMIKSEPIEDHEDNITIDLDLEESQPSRKIFNFNKHSKFLPRISDM